MTLLERPVSVLLFALLVMLGCSEPPAGSGSAALDEAVDVLATVNGDPVTGDDVAYWLRGSHGQPITSEVRSNTLERLIETELVYQRARELGLHRDPTYQKKVRGMELTLRATQRSEMLKRFYNQEIAAKVEVDLQETRAYYDANEQRIARSLHLGTIQFETAEQAGEALRALREADRVEALEEPRHGWDLGSMSWSSIPAEWHDVVYALAPGEVSGVFRGKETGVVLFKLYATAPDPESELEQVRAAIAERIGSDADPSAYYEANRERIGRTLHLGMLPFASQAKAQAALARLGEGLSFDELGAALQSEGRHATRRSWVAPLGRACRAMRPPTPPSRGR